MEQQIFDSFNAPQYSTFDDSDLIDADDYFAHEHENGENKQTDDCDQDTEFFSPMKENDMDILCLRNREVRRSLSVGDIGSLQPPALTRIDIEKLNESFEKLEIERRKLEQRQNTAPQHSKPKKPERNKSCGSMNLNKAKQFPSSSRLRSSSQENVTREKYVTVAEAVNIFQDNIRFHALPKNETRIKSNENLYISKTTVAQSPALSTKTRSRPVYYLTREQKEELEMEEAKKFKIKAHPLNKKVLQGPLKPLVPPEKKQTTIPVPFNITAPPKKVPTPLKVEEPIFHANPVPKCIYKAPQLKKVEKIQITEPKTPTFMKKMTKGQSPQPKINGQAEHPRPLSAQRNTKPIPFSFERRYQEVQQKKEQMINKVLEEEKKAREFHARPVPKSILFMSPSVKGKNHHSSHESVKTNKSDDASTSSVCFKAKPPTVLYKKPFLPKKEEHPLTEITEFSLNTDRRAKEREEFERELKEKEKLTLTYKLKAEEEQKRREEEERAFLRKQAEHKAQPIKKYKKIIIMPSNKITEPLSPKFHCDKLRNKENNN